MRNWISIKSGINHGLIILVVFTIRTFRFILNCMRSYLRYDVLSIRSILNCICSSNRFLNCPIHNRKFALFPGSTKQSILQEKESSIDDSLLGETHLRSELKQPK
jgi:hypothetical protein